MIIRFVKMTFYAENAIKFESIFAERQALIAACNGCVLVELLKERNKNSEYTVYFTRSIWNEEKDLELYRNSALFLETWRLTKALFSEKAQAWSMEII